MFKELKSKVTPFGGIAAIHKKVLQEGLPQFIDNELGARVKLFGFQYSDILLSRFYTAFCGANATEDVKYIKENTLDNLQRISIPSPDTILRSDVELSTACSYIETESGTENKINVNEKLNRFLIRTSVKLSQLKPQEKKLIYDFDHQFIPCQKYDARYSYKNKKGYFPGVAAISNIPVYIEGRNGNCNVKTEQLATHKRILKALSQEGISPSIARMDSGSYLTSVTDWFEEKNIRFFIRANNSNTLLSQAANCTDWKKCEINYQDMEISSFKYHFGKHEHRIIAYRVPNDTGQMSLITGDAKNYMFIITNDWEIGEKQAVIFYDKRGDSERVFDIQNNDFNWNSLPNSFLEENTVYLIIMATAHVIYKWLLSIFSSVIEGLTPTSRLKKFIYKFVAIVAKFTRNARRNVVHLATDNQQLINLVNSS